MLSLFGPQAQPSLPILAEKLKEQGYRLFLPYTPDHNLFVGSDFAYRPKGNILELVRSDTPPLTYEAHIRQYGEFLSQLNALLEKIDPIKQPKDVVDSVSALALTQNLFEYPKFHQYYFEQGYGSKNDFFTLQNQALQVKLNHLL